MKIAIQGAAGRMGRMLDSLAAGFGLDPSQFATLGAMLGAQGAFDEDEEDDDDD